MKRLDLTEMRFFRWKVKRFAFSRNGKPYWLCVCDCGAEKAVRSTNLIRGTQKSCGCYRRELAIKNATYHGHKKQGRATSTYTIWRGIRSRCLNSKSPAFKHYGGRGIVICERWHKFENFLADMGERPSANLTIDRIDNNGPYSPNNCRWATQKQQANNRRNNRQLSYNGLTLSVSEWAKKLGIGYHAIMHRIYNNKPIHLILKEANVRHD